MSLADRFRRRRAVTPDGLVPADEHARRAAREAAAAAGEPAGPEPHPDLVAQRERLVERFAAMQADLGGVFYEMAIRDHVRLDVLTRKAAELQRVDTELAEVERALRGDQGPAAGACPSCGAAHGLDARFCATCGFALPARPDAPATFEPVPVGAPPAADPGASAAGSVNGFGGHTP